MIFVSICRQQNPFSVHDIHSIFKQENPFVNKTCYSFLFLGRKTLPIQHTIHFYFQAGKHLLSLQHDIHFYFQAAKPIFNATTATRRKKVHQHYEDLEQCYFSIRQKRLFEFEDKNDGLDEFTESLSKFTRFSSFRPLATLCYASDMYNGSSNIVSR